MGYVAGLKGRSRIRRTCSLRLLVDALLAYPPYELLIQPVGRIRRKRHPPPPPGPWWIRLSLIHPSTGWLPCNERNSHKPCRGGDRPRNPAWAESPIVALGAGLLQRHPVGAVTHREKRLGRDHPPARLGATTAPVPTHRPEVRPPTAAPGRRGHRPRNPTRTEPPASRPEVRPTRKCQNMMNWNSGGQSFTPPGSKLNTCMYRRIIAPDLVRYTRFSLFRTGDPA